MLTNTNSFRYLYSNDTQNHLWILCSVYFVLLSFFSSFSFSFAKNRVSGDGTWIFSKQISGHLIGDTVGINENKVTYYVWLEPKSQVWHTKVSMIALMEKGERDVRNNQKNKVVSGWKLNYDYLSMQTEKSCWIGQHNIMAFIVNPWITAYTVL